MTAVSIRSYLAAGVAVVGAGALAMTPVQPVGPVALAPQHAAELAVSLAAAVDPITPWTDAIAGALNNFGALVNDWASGSYVAGTLPFPPNTGLRPGGLPNNGTFNGNLGWRTGGYATGGPLPITQQIFRNVLAYLGALPDIGSIVQQIFGNIGNAVQAPFEVGVSQVGRLDGVTGAGLGNLEFNQNVNADAYVTLPVLGLSSQRDVGALLPVLVPEATYAQLKPVIDFATTPVSGLLVGALGPIIGPVISVVTSLQNTIALLQQSDFLGGLNELINLPANAVNAFLNGGPNLDLTGLVEALGVELPSTVTAIGLKMGGLLSPGGVAFDALSAEASILGIGATIPGHPVGPVGALIGLTNYVAKAIAVAPPTPNASARAAASGALPDAAAEPTRAELTAAVPDEAVVVADRAPESPAPTKHRQARRSAAATADGGADSAAASAAKTAPKASAARRGAR